MIGHDGASIRLIATQNHVAAALSAKDKSRALEGSSNLAAGQIGGQRGQAAEVPASR